VQLKRDSNFARLADRIAPARSARVLLVDPDTTRRVAFATQARSWGIKVAVVPDGDRARSALATGNAFDLLLLHQQAEGLDQVITSARAARIAVLVPVGCTARAELAELGVPLMWLSAPLRSTTLIDALLGKKLPPIDLPEMLNDKAKNVRVNVLVVEDSEANRLVMRAQLERLNCTVETVDNGAAAIRLVGQHRFDLVLTDLALPDMSGLEVASRIRRLNGDLGKVPIVAVTGGVHPQDRDRCLAAGMNGYLTKPLSKKDLTQVLDRYVQKKGGADSALFDVSALERLSEELGSDIQLDVLTAFERELTQRLGYILNETSARAVAAQAHALKSAANAFGAQSLGLIAKQLEALCQAPGQADAWHEARRELIRVGRLTLTELANWLDADAGGTRPIV
jgi:CheY-like chemotaxis protein/HPt (histidine-containing phosphotransfer) domain-containing protein